MKKMTTLFILLFATFTLVNAEEPTGQQVFDSKCVACHTEQMPEKMDDLKAPPMSKISAKIKHAFDDNKTAFTGFIADYIQEPSEEKAKCMQKAIENFGLMPAIGKTMTKEERNAVSEWMFDNFDEKWESKDCASGDCKGKEKCGTDTKSALSKCGGDKNSSTEKCGAGKCGGK